MRLKKTPEQNKTVAQEPEIDIVEENETAADNQSGPEPAPQDPSPPTITNPPTEKGQQIRGTGTQTIEDWVTYEIPNFSFDYPSAMSLRDSIAGYRDGAGYANIVIQSNDGKGTLLLVTYNNFSEDNFAGNNAEEIAASILARDNNAEQDRMGLLHKGIDKSTITIFTNQQGYGTAEVMFRMPPDEGNGTKLFYGYGMQFYNFNDKVGVGIRVISLNDTTAVEIRDKIVTSLRIG